MNVTQIDNFVKCTGCFACCEKCPTKAIDMELDSEGFYFPKVNDETCVDCGVCIKTCPIISDKKLINKPLDIFSAYATDIDIRMKSSSGGIFSLLANKVLSEHGVVYGAAFDKALKEVCHTSTDVTSLYDIMRSKYVQSRIGHVFNDVESNLKAGRTVLFTGTPCQIKGLMSFLDEEYTNLLTIDFMCHGVPSTGLFKDVISYYERAENSEVIDFTFREKDRGWRDQITKIYLANGKVLSNKSSYYYYYYYMFLKNYTVRKACLDCSCYNTHESDITLADNWSIIDDDNKGVSLILINTEKGKKAFFSIAEQTSFHDYSAEYSGYDRYKHNYSAKNRAAFFDYYHKYGYQKTLSVFCRKQMKKRKFLLIKNQILKKIKIIKKMFLINAWIIYIL